MTKYFIIKYQVSTLFFTGFIRSILDQNEIYELKAPNQYNLECIKEDCHLEIKIIRNFNEDIFQEFDVHGQHKQESYFAKINYKSQNHSALTEYPQLIKGSEINSDNLYENNQKMTRTFLIIIAKEMLQEFKNHNEIYIKVFSRQENAITIRPGLQTTDQFSSKVNFKFTSSVSENEKCFSNFLEFITRGFYSKNSVRVFYDSIVTLLENKNQKKVEKSSRVGLLIKLFQLAIGTSILIIYVKSSQKERIKKITNFFSGLVEKDDDSIDVQKFKEDYLMGITPEIKQNTGLPKKTLKFRGIDPSMIQKNIVVPPQFPSEIKPITKIPETEIKLTEKPQEKPVSEDYFRIDRKLTEPHSAMPRFYIENQRTSFSGTNFQASSHFKFGPNISGNLNNTQIQAQMITGNEPKKKMVVNNYLTKYNNNTNNSLVRSYKNIPSQVMPERKPRMSYQSSSFNTTSADKKCSEIQTNFPPKRPPSLNSIQNSSPCYSMSMIYQTEKKRDPNINNSKPTGNIGRGTPVQTPNSMNMYKNSKISCSEWKTPQSVIDHYAPYKNKHTKYKTKSLIKTKFQIDEKYEIIDSVGQGSYAIVVAARNTETEEVIAIKKIEKVFEHKLFARRTLRELKICRLMKHDNINGIKTILLPKSREEFDDIYIITDLMQTDLASVIKAPQPQSDDHIKLFTYQILRGLKYIHSTEILHRDLKPRNQLVNQSCDLKICDFGFARSVIDDIKVPGLMFTDYVATRWYRAPEIILGQQDYGAPVDVWSVGCILAELLGRKSFLCGASSDEQLKIIIDLLGTPSEKDMQGIEDTRIKDFIKRLPEKKQKSFEKLFPDANKEALDLLSKMLIFNQNKRVTVEDCLSHPYLASLHLPEDEPTGRKVRKIDFEFEMYDLTKEQLKDLIYEEILLYHYEEKRREHKKEIKQGRNYTLEWVLNNDNRFYIDQDASSADDDSIF